MECLLVIFDQTTGLSASSYILFINSSHLAHEDEKRKTKEGLPHALKIFPRFGMVVWAVGRVFFSF